MLLILFLFLLWFLVLATTIVIVLVVREPDTKFVLSTGMCIMLFFVTVIFGAQISHLDKNCKITITKIGETGGKRCD